MAQLSKPQLRVGGLSKKVYVVTHGKEIKNDKGNIFEATRKYDVQDQFEAVAKELGWSRQPANGVLQEAVEHALDAAKAEDEFDATDEIAFYRKALGRDPV